MDIVVRVGGNKTVKNQFLNVAPRIQIELIFFLFVKIISKSTSSKSSNITPKRLDFSQSDQADIFEGHFLYVL